MKNRQTLYAGGVLILLAVIYFFTQTGDVDTKKIDVDMLQVDKSLVEQVAIKTGTVDLELVRTGDSWKLENYPVDTTRMKRLLDQFTGLGVDRIITRNADNYEKYQVTDESPRVALNPADGSTLLELIIGKQGANYQETFVRQAGEDPVYAVKTSLRQYTTQTQADYWDKTITDFDVNQISGVIFSGEVNYTLKREGVVWTYDGEMVDLEKVMNLLRPLGKIKGSGFADTEIEPERFTQAINITLESGVSITLETYLQDDEGKMLLVKSNQKSKILTYSKSNLNRYDKHLSDLIADPVPAES